MIDPFGGFIILSALVYTFCIYMGYYIYGTFEGIIAGVIVATAILYLPRDLLLGIVDWVVTSE